MSQTKAERAAYMRAWRKKNPEKAWAIQQRKRQKQLALHPDRVKKYKAKWRSRNRDTIALHAIHKAYAITADRYQSMLVSQNGVCAICRGVNVSGKRLSIDHDHATGHVRGLLCLQCNSGLGQFRDDPARIRLAAEYLEKHMSGNQEAPA